MSCVKGFNNSSCHFIFLHCCFFFKKNIFFMLSLTTNRQCLFLNVCLSRLFRKGNTCHDLMYVNNNHSWGDVTKTLCNKLCVCKQEMCFIKQQNISAEPTLPAHYLLLANLPLTMWQKYWRLGFVIPRKHILNYIKHFITKSFF